MCIPRFWSRNLLCWYHTAYEATSKRQHEERWDVIMRMAVRLKLGPTTAETKKSLSMAMQVTLNIWGSGIGYISTYARVSVCMLQLPVCVCVCARMICTCEWAQVDCELGRWTFGAAFHLAAKRIRVHAKHTHQHPHTWLTLRLTLTLCNSSQDVAMERSLSTSNHISSHSFNNSTVQTWGKSI